MSCITTKHLQRAATAKIKGTSLLHNKEKSTWAYRSLMQQTKEQEVKLAPKLGGSLIFCLLVNVLFSISDIRSQTEDYFFLSSFALRSSYKQI